MNEAKLEILQLSDDNFQGYAILYIYSDSNLIDAVTLKKDFTASVLIPINSSFLQTIQITAKDLQTGFHIGSVSFPLSLLIDTNESSVFFLTSSQNNLQNDNSFIRIRSCSIEESSQSLHKIRENDRDFDIQRALQSELDIEKWKNTGIKQIREEMNASELARVSVMKKICFTVEKYETEISELKSKLGTNSSKSGVIIRKKNKIEEEIKAAKQA